MNQKVHFSEIQKFRQTWIWLVILVPPIVVSYGAIRQLFFDIPFGTNPTSDTGVIILWLILGIVEPIFFLYLRLIVEVREDGIYIRFFPFHRRFHPFLFNEIQRYKAVTYHPIREYGGWGIRWGRKGKAYNVSGNRGVELQLKNGKIVLIGSQNPEAVVKAMDETRGIYERT